MLVRMNENPILSALSGVGGVLDTPRRLAWKATTGNEYGEEITGDPYSGAALEAVADPGLLLSLLTGGAGALVGMAKFARKKAVTATERPKFFSRLLRAIEGGPESFVSVPAGQQPDVPAKIVKTSTGTKEIAARPGKPIPARPAWGQLQGYLEGKASPQEIDWVFGSQFEDVPEITKPMLLDAIERGGITVEEVRSGGRRVPYGDMYQHGIYMEGDPEPRVGIELSSRAEAKARARGLARDFFPPQLTDAGMKAFRDYHRRFSAGEIDRGEFNRLVDELYYGSPEYVIRPKPVIRRITRPEFGEPNYGEEWRIPGGQNYTETVLRLKPREQALRTTITDEELAKWIEERFGPADDQSRLFTPSESMAYVPVVRSDPRVLSAALDDINRGIRAKNARGRFHNSHWPEDNVAAWIITDDRRLPTRERMRLVQEIQSDWGQLGARHGFANDPPVQPKPAKWHENLGRYGTVIDGTEYHLFPSMTGGSWAVNTLGGDIGYARLLDEAKRLAEEHAARRMNLRAKGTPAFPFRGNAWSNLALRRGLMDAAADQSDVFAIAPGALVQGVQGGQLLGQVKNYDEVLPNLLQAIVGKRARLERFPVPGAEDMMRPVQGLPWLSGIQPKIARSEVRDLADPSNPLVSEILGLTIPVRDRYINRLAEIERELAEALLVPYDMNDRSLMSKIDRLSEMRQITEDAVQRPARIVSALGGARGVRLTPELREYILKGLPLLSALPLAYAMRGE